MVGAVGDRVSVDLVGPFPETERGNRYLLVAQDYFSKWTEIYAVPDATAVTCANVLVNEFFARFGIPLSVHSDQGRCFESELFSSMCSLLGIRHTRTSPYRPACNGLVERFNSTMVQMIKAYLEGKQSNWDLNLGCLEGAYRSSVHESTKYSPNQLMLGRELRKPANLVFGDPPRQEMESLGQYSQQLKDDLQEAHRITREHLKQAFQRQKDNYDVKLLVNKYKLGDAVWFLDESRKLHRCPKLQNIWQGPYLVIKKKSDLNYEIQINCKGKRKVVHHNKLKPYPGSKPQWMITVTRFLTNQNKNSER